MCSLSSCQLLRVLLAVRLGRVTNQSGGSSTVSLFTFVVCGTRFEGQDYCKWRSVLHGCQYHILPDVGNVRSQRGGSWRPPLFVKRGRELCDCFVSWFGVYGERAWVLVSALGLEQDGGGSILA